MKYYGAVGYVILETDEYGVSQEKIIERNYFGEVMGNPSRRWSSREYLHDDLQISQRISIVADPFIYNHLGDLRYLVWMNQYWKITDVEVERPRVYLTLGGVYNGVGNSTDTRSST